MRNELRAQRLVERASDSAVALRLTEMGTATAAVLAACAPETSAEELDEARAKLKRLLAEVEGELGPLS